MNNNNQTNEEAMDGMAWYAFRSGIDAMLEHCHMRTHEVREADTGERVISIDTTDGDPQGVMTFRVGEAGIAEFNRQAAARMTGTMAEYLLYAESQRGSGFADCPAADEETMGDMMWDALRDGMDTLLERCHMRTGEIRLSNVGKRSVSIYTTDGEPCEVLRFLVRDTDITEFGRQVTKAARRDAAESAERRFQRRMSRSLKRLEASLMYLDGRLHDRLKGSTKQVNVCYGVMTGETKPSAFFTVSEHDGECERHLLETHRPNDVLAYFGLETEAAE